MSATVIRSAASHHYEAGLSCHTPEMNGPTQDVHWSREKINFAKTRVSAHDSLHYTMNNFGGFEVHVTVMHYELQVLLFVALPHIYEEGGDLPKFTGFVLKG